MKTCIQLKLFATLKRFLPEAESDRFALDRDITVRDLLSKIGIPETEVKLIFIDGKKAAFETVLSGGERVGIFPPVGGG
ncbi:MAG: MoaD/ThiS family protein [Desulfobacteraceae bacterium]|nr:MAG: MoaD/ThiS family protein [Desulfobacteraceae bacterium]